MKIENINIFESISNTEHEQVVFCNDNDTGLKAIIAVHDTTLGPALGGTRVWKYQTEADALNDVLRLSRGMTYKSAISGINLGGGKAVILADDKILRDEFFWRRYGRFVEKLSGKYITAEDVGTSTKEIEYIYQETKHVSGKPIYLGGGGDPSPFTAYGVYLAMKASWKKLSGTDSLNGVNISVQGVGHVGYFLVENLIKENAIVSIADINENNIKLATKQFDLKVLDPNEILFAQTDIIAPCALGAIINNDSIDKLKTKIVCGAANNQLLDEKVHGDLLKEKNILYAPDFLINAGGVINCYSEAIGTYSKEKTMSLTENIYDKTLEIYNKSSQKNINTQLAAIEIAKERIVKAKNLSSKL